VLSNLVEAVEAFVAPPHDASATATPLATGPNFGFYVDAEKYGIGLDIGFTFDVSTGYQAPMYN
jgi:hypothetical protein